nr:hypothetical protein [Tanacetum cinerariifolium]
MFDQLLRQIAFQVYRLRLRRLFLLCKGNYDIDSHCEKGQADVIDVISYFGFLGPECIPQDPSCTSIMMLLAYIGPTHLNHGDISFGRIPSFRYSRMGTIQLSLSSLTMTVISFSATDLVCITSTKTSFASFEKVIDASLLRASAFFSSSLLICSIEYLGKLDRRPIVFSSPTMSASYSASLLVVSNLNLNAYVYSFPSGFTNINLAPKPSELEASLVKNDVSARKSASIYPLIEFRPLNFISCSPNSMAHLATRPDFSGFARTCFI